MIDEKGCEVYFKVLYNKAGEVIGVEPPKGREVRVISDCDLYRSPMEINGISTTLILSKPGNSPCCVKMGRWMWCWCK